MVKGEIEEMGERVGEIVVFRPPSNTTHGTLCDRLKANKHCVKLIFEDRLTLGTATWSMMKSVTLGT